MARNRHLSRRFELDPGSSLRGATRLLAYGGMTLSLSPLQLGLLPLHRRASFLLPRLYHRLTCRILGIDVEMRGMPSPRHPTLFVANHGSYLDIPILGSLITGAFVAKSEVAGWPMFGWLSKMQRTVFVDRRRHTTHRQRDSLQRQLELGDDLILFPEGTSNDGNRVLPFRSALFSVAEREVAGQPLTVQPVSVAYVGLGALPMGHRHRPYLAWYGDMTLGGHLWNFVRLPRVRVVVEFHPVVTIADFGSRKALAQHCYDKVSGGVSAALAGRSDG
ncbi:lyso-ornithine lipid acyltransferase [Dongia mobilis]|uniref:Lyso-ornithine lipid acyltransferase n=1 Tax=Dongia mobilis TaxID=578943 RepID=A0A4R6WSP0_9PROT|nr:lysophospholipid acyltransferase family protein [Dongia mobilis]TDQ85421.1 lyso-ornithine lipid acyltransferase [Dongia mobilis]